MLNLPFYDENPSLYPVRTLICCKDQISSLRANSDKLFVSYRKPFGNVTSQTLSYWIKDVLHKSGIDTSVFGAHSTRHASTSKAKCLGINLDIIRKTAGWDASSSVFARFYNKEIVCNQNDTFAIVLASALVS